VKGACAAMILTHVARISSSALAYAMRKSSNILSLRKKTAVSVKARERRHIHLIAIIIEFECTACDLGSRNTALRVSLDLTGKCRRYDWQFQRSPSRMLPRIELPSLSSFSPQQLPGSSEKQHECTKAKRVTRTMHLLNQRGGNTERKAVW
jgi:hypothetical protein